MMNSVHERAVRLAARFLTLSAPEAAVQIESLLQTLADVQDYLLTETQKTEKDRWKIFRRVNVANRMGRIHKHNKSCYDDPGPAHSSPQFICGHIDGLEEL